MGSLADILPKLLVISVVLFQLTLGFSEEPSWDEFKRAHRRRYKNVVEETQRRAIFKKNIEKISKHNMEHELGIHTYEKRINQYADLTDDELLETDCCSITQPTKRARRYNEHALHTEDDLDPEVKIPDEIDYREMGAVTPIKVQGMCASCWAFGTIGAVESHNYLVNNELVQLSEQQLTDCSMDNGGCRGGHHTDAYYYILKHGVTKSKVYPYRGHPDTCHYNNISMKAVEILDYKNIPSGNEEEMKRIVGTKGPVTVGFFVDPDMKRHKSGVYYNPNCAPSPKQINHAAVVVGYGTDKDTKMDYWIVKNSGGKKWGDEGYIRIARNQGNMCNIASFATYPVVKDVNPFPTVRKPKSAEKLENQTEKTPRRKNRKRKRISKKNKKRKQSSEKNENKKLPSNEKQNSSPKKIEGANTNGTFNASLTNP